MPGIRPFKSYTHRESTANPLLKRLRDIRIEKGLTQEDVADALGCKQNQISEFEMGRKAPSLSRILKWADFLRYKVSLEQL